MAFRREGGTVFVDDTVEREILRLCEEIPNLGVVCLHPDRGASAAMRFYLGLDLSLRKQFPMENTRHRTNLPNGSFIVYISTFSMFGSFVSRLPEEEYHIVMLYGVTQPAQIVGVLNRIKHPGKHVGKEYDWLFPLCIAGDNIYMHKEVEHFMETQHVQRDEVIYGLKKEDMFEFYNHPRERHIEPDVKKYSKAKEILEEEEELDIAEKEYQEYLDRKAKKDEIKEKYMRRLPHEEFGRQMEMREIIERGADGIIDEDNE